MTHLTLTQDEQIALAILNSRVNALRRTHPNVATRKYSLVEQIPAEVLTPGIVRAVIRDELKDEVRAKSLEQYVVERIRINEVDFLAWEQNPSLVRGA